MNKVEKFFTIKIGELSPGDLILLKTTTREPTWVFILEDSWFDYSDGRFYSYAHYDDNQYFTVSAEIHLKLDE